MEIPGAVWLCKAVLMVRFYVYPMPRQRCGHLPNCPEARIAVPLMITQSITPLRKELGKPVLSGRTS